jgi:hypothetical protein
MNVAPDGFRVEREVHPKTGAIKFRFYLHDKKIPNVPIAGKIVERLNGFGMIYKDLENVLAWLNEAEKLLATVKPEPDTKFLRMTDRALGNQIKSLFVASIAFYAKAFTRADGRNAGMNKRMIDSAFHDAHDDMMKYRHNFVAHSGVEKLEYGESCILLWPVDDDNFRLTIHSNRTQLDFALPSGDCERFALLVEHVMTKAEGHYDKIASKIGEAALKQKPQYWMAAYGLSKTISMDGLLNK